MKKNIFIFYSIITILFFGMLIKLEFATDTYAVFNFNKDEIFSQFATSGRFITAIVGRFVKIFGFSNSSIYKASYILAVFCTIISQYKLYTIIGKDVENKILKIIIPTLIIINPFSIEIFLFIEKGMMWLGVLVCIISIQNIKKYFEVNDKKYILLCACLLFIANSIYQGTVGIFFSVSLIYILKYSKSIKKFIKLNLITGLIYLTPAVANYCLAKFTYKSSRMNGQISFLNSIIVIFKNTVNMSITMYNLLPKYTFILLILFTFMVFCSKMWKERNNILQILKFLYIIFGVTFFSIAPQFVQPTYSIWFVPRATYCFGALYGIILLYFLMDTHTNYLSRCTIIAISIIVICFQITKFIQIENDRFRLNKKDLETTMLIIKQIEQYELETGNVITEISFYEDKFPNYTYNKIFSTGDINVKCYANDWSTVEIISFYLKRKIKLVKKNEYLAKKFKNTNWNEFNIEQILFERNRINLCNY